MSTQQDNITPEERDPTARVVGDSYKDSTYILDKKGSRIWVNPKKPVGKFYNRRSVVSYLLLFILFATPFAQINNAPLFLFNVIERKFVMFGIVFWPQDFFLVVLALLSLAIFAVTFTAIFGRIWCGWLCPQTIFLEMVFRKIEYWIEGNANQKVRLRRQPWNMEKIIKIGSKQILFYAISFAVANLLLSYIIGIDQVFEIMSEPIEAHLTGFTVMMVFSLVFYSVFAWFREQACTFVCPYGRLQSVLLDKNTLVVAYDHKRGENREKYKKKGRSEDAGDCVDCKQCLYVCPTGIDIRNGTQLECVNCTACIDACNVTMEKLGFEPDLIRYASENQIESGEKFKITARIKAYAIILVLVFTLFLTFLLNREDLSAVILRAKGQVSQDIGDKIRNVYTYKLINKSAEKMTITMDVEGFDNEVITPIGYKEFNIEANKIMQGSMLLDIPKSALSEEKNNIVILIKSGDRVVFESKTVFTAQNFGK